MTGEARAPRERRGAGLHEQLRALVRPEFAGEMIRVAGDDPVFGRGLCDAAGCQRPAWTRGVCQAHYLRWRHHGQPDLAVFAATTGPIAETARAGSINAFDLGRLPPSARLEVAYVIQCRHDDRGPRLLATHVRHFVGMLADAGVDSLLDLPLAA